METVINGKTGLFFDEQTPESLREAINRFEKQSFKPEECRAQAEKFSPDIFRKNLKAEIDKALGRDKTQKVAS